MRGNAQFILKVNFEPSTWISNKTIREVGNIFFVVVVDVFMRQTLTDDFFLEGVGYTKI